MSNNIAVLRVVRARGLKAMDSGGMFGGKKSSDPYCAVVLGDVRLKTALRLLVDRYDLDMILTPSQSLVLRNIEPKHRLDVEGLLKEHGVKMIHEVDAITRKSIACPAFPLCGLAMAEAERAQIGRAHV